MARQAGENSSRFGRIAQNVPGDRREAAMPALPTGETRLFPVLGDPIAQVRSPQSLTRIMRAREQNAKAALNMSDYGLVLELGQMRMHDRAENLLADPRVGQLFLGGHVEPGDAA